jgi:very-short-patch-repair endonuclease
MIKCRNCGKEITGKGKTGLCNRCILIERNTKILPEINRKYPRDNKCEDCGKDISKKAKRCNRCNQKGRVFSEKHKSSIRKMLLVRWKNPVFYEKMVKIRKEQAKNPITRAKINKKLCSREKTCFEDKLDLLIKQLNLPFKFVGDGKITIHGFCPDFIDEARKLIIEVFYDYWKIRQYGSVKKYVTKKYSAYRFHGYETLFVNKEMMCDWPEKKLKQILLNFNKNEYCDNKTVLK